MAKDLFATDSSISEPKDLFASDSPKDLMQTESKDSGVSTLDRFLSAGIGGIPASVGGAKDPEKSLSFLGQTIGAGIGSSAGPLGSYTGGVAGAGVGSALEELITSAKKGTKYDLKKVGSDTAMTALVDGLLRGAGSSYFRREIANETLNSLGRKLGTMKSELADMGQSNPSLSIPKQKVLDFLNETFDKTINPFGKASVVLKRWRNILSNPKTTNISPRALIELEDDLGDIATFAKQKIGGVSLVPDVQKSAMNTAAKRLRGIVSQEVDTVAEKAGLKDFAKTSKQIAKLKEKFPISELKKNTLFPGIPQTFTAASSGVLAGALSQNPVVGITTGFLIESLQSPAVRNSLYDGLVKNGLGNVASLVFSEAGREASK